MRMKRAIIINLIAILILLLLIFGSYIVINYSVNHENGEQTTNFLFIQYHNNGTEYIKEKMEDQYFEFTITNNSSNPITYDLELLGQNNKKVSNFIQNDEIKYELFINDNQIALYDKFDTRLIKAKESIRYKFRIIVKDSAFDQSSVYKIQVKIKE